MNKRLIIKDSTRKRCKVFRLEDGNRNHFQPVSMELFHYLYEVETIDFSIYVRVDDEMIEFIRAKELSKDLLHQIWFASLREDSGVEICVAKRDHQRFHQAIDSVRDKKVKKILEKEPSLDQKTMNVFANLSGASQMILRGGITIEVTKRVAAAASYMVSNLMDNNYAMATLSRMIQIDPTLYDHSASVAMLSGVIGKQFYKDRISTKQAEILSQCGLYHDAGKSCIPHAILNKPTSFTAEEFEVMKTHAILGYNELTKAIDGGAPIDRVVAEVALQHHERFNGSGYPTGKKGRMEEAPETGIHPYARIVAIADSYSALLMERVYKPAIPAEEAIKMLESVASAHYDPDFFGPFMLSLKRSLNLLEVRKKEITTQIYMVEDGDNVAAKIKSQQQSGNPHSEHNSSPSSHDAHHGSGNTKSHKSSEHDEPGKKIS